MLSVSMARTEAAFTLRNVSLLAAALLLALLPFDLEHMVLMAFSALLYFYVDKLQANLVVPRSKALLAAHTPKFSKPACSRSSCDCALSPAIPKASQKQCAFRDRGFTQTVMPIAAPTFCSTSFDGEVHELAAQLVPTEACERGAKEIGSLVQRGLCQTLPVIEVFSFASSNIQSRRAFGVAVPDIEIVAIIDPQALNSLVRKRIANPPQSVGGDVRHMQKSLLRTCTDCLVAQSGMKFRRSAFQADDPKVIFLAPTSLGIADVSLPFELSVNATAPSWNAALTMESGQIEPRARGLILLVRRWAKDRGICHAAKGHLAPHVWTLLVIYYLQVGVDGEGPLLPPLQGFEITSKLMIAGTKNFSKNWSQKRASQKSLCDLLVGFFHFYAQEFDWRNEAISVSAGVRAAPSPSLCPHIVMDEATGVTRVAPCIEDPFATGRNLSKSMTIESLTRLTMELARASSLCAQGSSLVVLLELWAPENIAEEKTSACVA